MFTNKINSCRRVERGFFGAWWVDMEVVLGDGSVYV